MDEFKLRIYKTKSVLMQLEDALELKREEPEYHSFYSKERYGTEYFVRKTFVTASRNRSLKVIIETSGLFYVIYDKKTQKSTQKREYDLSKYLINSVVASLNKACRSFLQND